MICTKARRLEVEGEEEVREEGRKEKERGRGEWDKRKRGWEEAKRGTGGGSGERRKRH
ncbi:MAG: hypothetical protein ACK55O_08070 [Phycisphaerales bacterium]